MRALVYTGPNALELREESVPTAVDEEVVVKVEAVGICGSDMHAYHGYDSRRPAPLILGHEAAGRIVTGPRAGERVAINPLIVDPACP
jgi:threonine dehydrogenase-like Zn-dependent dehydrogenase